MAGALWGGEGGGFVGNPGEQQLMNPSIWGPGDPAGPPPNPSHWNLPPGHPQAGPPHAFPAQPPMPSHPSHPSHPGFVGVAKSPWDGWGQPPGPAGPGHPNGWGAPPNAPPQPWAAPQPSGPAHNMHGGGSGGSRQHMGHSGAPPPHPSVPPHQQHSSQFQWSNAPSFPAPGGSSNSSGPRPPMGPRGPMFEGPGGWQPHPGKPEHGEWGDMKGTGHWGDPNAQSSHHGGGGGGGWGQGPPRPDWQPSGHHDNGTGIWNQGGGPQGPGPHHAGGWSGGPHHHQPAHDQGRQWNQPHQQPPPQPPPDNIWVPPGPQESNSDMIWHDPNPKTKKPVIDKGTSAWGDPGDAKWGEIKRWKDGSEDVVPAPGSAWDGSPLAPGSGPSTSLHPGHPAPTTAAGPTPATKTTTTGWGDPPPAPPNPSWGGNGGGEPRKENGQGDGPSGWIPGESGGNLQDLTAQIASQLRVAVSKGLINMNILNQPLPQNVLLVLNNLLQRVPKLESATNELNALQNSPSAGSPSQQAEIQRLQGLVEKLKTEISELQNQINRSTPGDKAEEGGDGSGSRLMRLWSAPGGAKGSATASALNLEGLAEDMHKLGMGGGDANPWAVGGQPPGLADWSMGNGDSQSDAGPKTRSGDNSQGATPTPDNPVLKEFVPGKKWEWEDPNQRALDPNATPGSIKPNPLSVGSGLSAVPSSGSLASVSLAGSITPTKMLSEQRSTNLSPSISAGIWGGSQSVPVTSGGRFSRSVSSPVQQGGQGGQGGSAFAPYQAGGAPAALLLSKTGGASEAALRGLCEQHGSLQFLPNPAQQMAVAKFPDNLAALPRLAQELQALGVSVAPVDDARLQAFFNPPPF